MRSRLLVAVVLGLLAPVASVASEPCVCPTSPSMPLASGPDWSEVVDAVRGGGRVTLRGHLEAWPTPATRTPIVVGPPDCRCPVGFGEELVVRVSGSPLRVEATVGGVAVEVPPGWVEAALGATTALDVSGELADGLGCLPEARALAVPGAFVAFLRAKLSALEGTGLAPRRWAAGGVVIQRSGTLQVVRRLRWTVEPAAPAGAPPG